MMRMAKTAGPKLFDSGDPKLDWFNQSSWRGSRGWNESWRSLSK